MRRAAVDSTACGQFPRASQTLICPYDATGEREWVGWMMRRGSERTVSRASSCEVGVAECANTRSCTCVNSLSVLHGVLRGCTIPLHRSKLALVAVSLSLSHSLALSHSLYNSPTSPYTL